MNYYIEDDKLVFKLEGKLIMSNSDNTKNKIKYDIDEVLKEDKLEYVIFDLQDLEFIDSTGVGVFISIFKFVKERDLDLKLLQPQDIVRKVLTITKIDNIMAIEY